MIFWIFFLILSLIVEVYLWWKLQASLFFLSGRTCTIGGWLNTYLPHCTYMSSFDVTYAHSHHHPSGYLLWFHLHFLLLNSYHLLMLTVLLILSAPLLHLVSTLSAPYLPGQPMPPLLPLGCLMFSANIVLSSGLPKGCGANKKNPTDLIVYQSLLSSFSANVSTAKRTNYFFPHSLVFLLPILHQI